MEKVYRHYGHKEFELEKFEEIKNREMFVKPNGGLWASRLTKEQKQGDWREWVDAEHFLNEFGQKYARDNYFDFKLRKDAKVLTIRSSEELLQLPKIDNFRFVPFVMLDFEKIAKEYDAMEVLISEDVDRGIGEGLYWDLYGWDCDSLLVFNKEIVEVIE